jgi:hypothetical protein
VSYTVSGLILGQNPFAGAYGGIANAPDTTVPDQAGAGISTEGGSLMRYAGWVKRRATAVVAAGALVVAGITVATSWAAIARATPGTPAAPARYATAGMTAETAHEIRLRLNLTPMPTGTVTTGITPTGQQFVLLDVYGLTPGSAHTVTLGGKPIGTLTANATGMAVTIFNVPAIGLYNRVRILNDGSGTSVIAVTPAMGISNGPYPLRAVEAGFPLGTLRGHATFVYNPVAETITVTVTATGFSPGRHAAHIHIGSCASQGPVLHMLRDFVADKFGNINDESRVVTGVTAVPATGWYLNLHQGNSQNILTPSGQPTIYFRPLLCNNIVVRQR